MPPTGRMRHLTTVQGSFHGRVVAARLGAEGVLTELRGMSEGPYPLQGAVEVFVGVEQLDLAREILLADAVDAAVDEDRVALDYPRSVSEEDIGLRMIFPDERLRALSAQRDEPSHRRVTRLGTAIVLALVAALVIVGVLAVAH